VGPLTALVCVHAHSEAGGLLETDAAQLDRHFAVNARGTALLMAEFARRFRGELPEATLDGRTFSERSTSI